MKQSNMQTFRIPKDIMSDLQAKAEAEGKEINEMVCLAIAREAYSEIKNPVEAPVVSCKSTQNKEGRFRN
ncbi:hypothetical protein [Sansalvadorimonas verongulae]|uniref:hypothetical protein n=1 Tax=Sansalvadorimonas verongulae TaxID=2172824 RepID=UPI0012BD421B|nr:hypothetical protein [Sansalvadorimonas verongulae]MTI13187.1 hypothetical protein [Sansalvadorimonas verongulae]